jgi:soluble cytochrome b562
MKIRTASLLLLALPILSPFTSLADTPAAPAPAGAHEDEKKTELELRMGRVGKAFRKLRKQVADPAQNESSLQLIATMQDAAREALQFTPEKAEDIPADQRPKFVQDFKDGINHLLDKLSGLKDAVAAGKNDEATKMAAEILDFEKKEHKEFKRPDKD